MNLSKVSKSWWRGGSASNSAKDGWDDLLGAALQGVRRGTVSGRLLGLQTEAALQVTAQMDAAAEVTRADIVAIIDSASFELGRDLRIRSPKDINLALNFFMAIMQILQTALTLYQFVHGQPPSQPEIFRSSIRRPTSSIRRPSTCHRRRADSHVAGGISGR